MTIMNSLQKKPSQVLKKGEAINELCCLSVLSSSRTIDLVAPSNRVRDDWLWALRMLLVHFNSTSSLKEVATQRRLAGEKRLPTVFLFADTQVTEKPAKDEREGRMTLLCCHLLCCYATCCAALMFLEASADAQVKDEAYLPVTYLLAYRSRTRRWSRTSITF